MVWGARDGAVVKALAPHLCGPGSNPGVNTICGLSLLLVLSLAPKGFSPGTPVFPSPQTPTLPNSNSTRNLVDEEPLCGCATSESLFIYLCIYLYVISGVDPSGNVLFMVQCGRILILTIVFHCFCSTFIRCLEITEILWFDSESIWWVASFTLTKTVQFTAAMYVLSHVTIIVENSSGAFKVMFWFWNFIVRFGISIRILPASVWNQVCPTLWV